MSILIKGMEIPKRCYDCQLLEGDTYEGFCHAANKWMDSDWWSWNTYEDGDIDDSKPANCPLVLVPPHGSLIDAEPYARPDLSEYSDKLWKAAYERGKAEAQTEQNTQWYSCTEPPSDDRSVFIAYGTKGLKSCCIGFYEADNEQWYEQKNFFASLIYDAKYWCDMPELPEGWYE